MISQQNPAAIDELATALPVTAEKFGQTIFPAVSAQQLHACLLIGREYRKWIESKIEENNLLEGRDFIVKTASAQADGSRIKRQVLRQQIVFKVCVALELAAHASNAQSGKLRAYLRSHAEASVAPSLGRVVKPPVKNGQPDLQQQIPDQTVAAEVQFDPVEVTEGMIGGAKCLVVDGRALWEKLGVSRDFNTWIKARIAEYGFIENTDFGLFPKSGEKSKSSGGQTDMKSKMGRPTVEFMLTLNTAKELAMVERNEMGRQARRYFIDCERKLFESSLADAAQARSVSQTEGEMYDRDWMPNSDIKVLTELVKARQDRAWMLAMQTYGEVLLLSRNEQASAAVACSYQARLADQIQENIKSYGEEVFSESGLKTAIGEIRQWVPPN